MSDKGVICVDFDNTLTTSIPSDWSVDGHDAKPDEAMIEAVTNAWKDGYTIIIWTARRWCEAPNIVGSLVSWQVPYHGLRCEKGAATKYVDDKAGDTVESFLEEYGTRERGEDKIEVEVDSVQFGVTD